MWRCLLFLYLKPVFFRPILLPITPTVRNQIIDSWADDGGPSLYISKLYETYNDTLLWRDDKQDYYMLVGNDTPSGFMVNRIIEKPHQLRLDAAKANFYIEQYRRNPEMDI